MTTPQPGNIFNQIRRLVKLIPPGKVAAYSSVARALGYRNSRLVGFAIRGNRDTTIPCHRVVFKDGSMAPNYSFGGARAQQLKLQSEGINFTPDNRVVMTIHLFNYDNCS